MVRHQGKLTAIELEVGVELFHPENQGKRFFLHLSIILLTAGVHRENGPYAREYDGLSLL